MTRSRRALASFAALAVAVVLPTGCAAHPAPTGTEEVGASFPHVPLVPASGAYLGAYYGDGDPESTDDAIARTLRIHLSYFGWNDPWTTDGTIEADRRRGQLTLVNWEPFDVDFAQIVDGEYDDMLTVRAAEAADLVEPVFVDFAAEMNEEEGWGGHDPELYIAAYRHVHDIFTANGATNVVWVWAPNNVDSPDSPAAMEYYPGDDHVDWTGIDGYNWGDSDPDFSVQSFREVFQHMYNGLHEIGKPIIIGETASAEEGTSKAEWIRSIPRALTKDFPDVKALVWFDVDKERDWRFRSSDASAEAFRQLAADPLFQTPLPGATR